MSDMPAIVTGVAAGLGVGLLLGAFFYGGLWWTVQRGLAGRYVAVWFLVSFLVRTAFVLAGLYLLARLGWVWLFAGAAGLLVARPLVTKLTAKASAA